MAEGKHFDNLLNCGSSRGIRSKAQVAGSARRPLPWSAPAPGLSQAAVAGRWTALCLARLWTRRPAGLALRRCRGPVRCRLGLPLPPAPQPGAGRAQRAILPPGLGETGRPLARPRLEGRTLPEPASRVRQRLGSVWPRRLVRTAGDGAHAHGRANPGPLAAVAGQLA